MSGTEVAAIVGSLGTILMLIGGGIGWFVKRIDDKVARLERRIRRLERHKIAAVRHIGRLEGEIIRMGGVLPETEGWPPDEEENEGAL